MKTMNKEILLRQMSANEYADEFRMAVGDALEQFGEGVKNFKSIKELADAMGITEKKAMNLLSGDVDLKLSDLARYAYMMGCKLRILLEEG